MARPYLKFVLKITMILVIYQQEILVVETFKVQAKELMTTAIQKWDPESNILDRKRRLSATRSTNCNLPVNLHPTSILNLNPNTPGYHAISDVMKKEFPQDPNGCD
jgi:hypothetical protein